MLKWEKLRAGYYIARDNNYTYEIMQVGEWYLTILRDFEMVYDNGFSTLKAAKQAAEADYMERKEEV